MTNDVENNVQRTIAAYLQHEGDLFNGDNFVDLGVDSWSLVELRTSLEVEQNVDFGDEHWSEIESPKQLLEAIIAKMKGVADDD